jgi:Ca2+-binding RTX toxin-like protein
MTEVRVNSNIKSGLQFSSDISDFKYSAGALGGGHIIVFEDQNGADGSSNGIFGQLYDSEGQALGENFLINSTTEGEQVSPEVAVLTNGDVVVSWFSTNGNNIYDYNIQRFTVNGTSLEPVGDEISIISDERIINDVNSEVIALSDGGFVVTYQDSESFAQIFDADGTPRTELFSPDIDFYNASPDVTELADGNILFTWQIEGAPHLSGLYGRIFDSEGNAVTDTLTLDDREGEQRFSDTVALDNGGFVSVWHAATEPNGDGPVLARTFDSNGNPVGDSFQVSEGNISGARSEYTLSATALSDDTIIVFHTENGVISGRHFSQSGILIGEPFDILELNTGTESNPTATLNAAGDLVVSYGSDLDIYTQTIKILSDDTYSEDEIRVNSDLKSGSQLASDVATFEDNAGALAGGHIIVFEDQNGADGSSKGIFAQLFGADGQEIGNNFLINNVTDGDQVSPEVTVLANGDVVVSWFSTDGNNIYDYNAQRFSLDGTSLEPVGDEITIASGEQIFGDLSSEIVALSDGGFVATFKNSESFAQIFDADGTPRTEVFSPDIDFYNASPDVTELADGNILFTWQIEGAPHLSGLYGRIFNSEGNAVSDTLTLDDREGQQLFSDTVALENGGFISVWHAATESNGDGPVVARIFNSDGNPVGDSFQISEGNISSARGDYTLSSTLLSDNTVVTFYTENGVIAGQRFTTSGQIIGEAFDVVALNTGTEADPTAALNAAGDLVVSYESEGDILTKTISFISDTAANITGTQLADTFFGSSANDIIDGRSGDDLIIAGLGDDDLIGNSGNDTISGGAGNDDIDGGASNDLLFGDAGNDIIQGGDNAGRDTIDGGIGNDTLTGGEGNDTFIFALNNGHDVITDFSNGDNIIDLTSQNLTFDDLTITQAGNDTVIEIDTDNSITLSGVEASNINANDFRFETLEATPSLDIQVALRDHVVTNTFEDGSFVNVFLAKTEPNGAGPIAAQIFNSDGNPIGDVFQVSAANVNPFHTDYSISAVSVSDGTIIAFYEDDGILLAQRFTNSGQLIGEEFDVAFENTGTEFGPEAALNEDGGVSVSYQSLDETVIRTFDFVSSDAIDTIGTRFEDTLFGSSENDILDGRSGSDLIIAGLGDDDLVGNSGDDTIFAGADNDTLDGGTGHDLLFGEAGDDILNGGILFGRDTLDGGAGDDTLTGGSANDTFVFGENSGNDTITDFARNSNVIDLTALDLALEDLTITQNGDNTVIELDADNSITLLNIDATTIDENDFLF